MLFKARLGMCGGPARTSRRERERLNGREHDERQRHRACGSGQAARQFAWTWPTYLQVSVANMKKDLHEASTAGNWCEKL